MGNYTSKLFPHHNEHDKNRNQTNVSPTSGTEKIRLCTPPVTKRKLTTDPRSATMGIIRTPIEVTCTPPGLTRRVASALPKYLQGKRYLETDFDAVVPSATPEKCIPDPRSPNVSQARTPIMVKPLANYLSPVVTVNQAPDMDTPVGIAPTVLSLDPRSPATDFDRTPILKPRSTERTTTNLGVNSIATSDDKNTNTVLSYCETTTDFSIPEIHTISEVVRGSSEFPNSENSSSGPIQKSKNVSMSSHVSSEDTTDGSDNEEQITVIPNTKVLSKHPDTLSAWAEEKIIGHIEDVVEETNGIDESLGKEVDNDFSEVINALVKNTIDEQRIVTCNDKIKVWRDSISPTIEENKNCAQKNEEVIIEFDDETTTKTPKIVGKINSQIDDETSKSQAKKIKSRQINGENKNLVDERKIFTNEAKNRREPSLNRTPLGNRSNNHKQRQLVSAKSPQQLFRNKVLSTRANQQENTPPTERFISKTKPHGIQWDADTTVII